MTQNEKVFRVRLTADSTGKWTISDTDGFNSLGLGRYVNDRGFVDDICHTYVSKAKAQAALDLYLEKEIIQERTMAKLTQEPVGGKTTMREYAGGATRDTTRGKLDYVKALSPIVLRRYVQYLDKHRLQPDGSYRDFDNWKHGMPQDVYHSSGGRHFFDAWLLTEGYATEDNHGPVEIEDVLCAELFNIMGRLLEILKVKEKKVEIDRTKPVSGGY